MEPFTLTSASFEDGGMIPTECTCEGVDQSPALAWAGAPGQTRSFALIMDDPDAPSGLFTHWLLFDIPATVQTLDSGQPVVGIAGVNDFQEPDYRGPCPPVGDEAHGYRFTLYALDVPSLGLSQRATRREVEGSLRDHVLGQAQLRGRYGRRERSAQA
jgi:Raf kinase inhibitor-like YbhB/YbcL family protein